MGICYHLLANHDGKMMAFTRIYFDLLESEVWFDFYGLRR